MRRLTQKQILMMHKQLVEQTGGSDKVLDYGLLDSALETPFKKILVYKSQSAMVFPPCPLKGRLIISFLLRVHF